jgi:hypothetical protein
VVVKRQKCLLRKLMRVKKLLGGKERIEGVIYVTVLVSDPFPESARAIALFRLSEANHKIRYSRDAKRFIRSNSGEIVGTRKENQKSFDPIIWPRHEQPAKDAVVRSPPMSICARAALASQHPDLSAMSVLKSL